LGGAEVTASDKNLINYWFRHIWEVSWVLYPAVLLAVGFLAGGQGRFFAAQASLTAVLAVAGYLALLTRVPAGVGAGRPALPSFGALRAALPLLLLVVLPLFHVGVDWTIANAIVAARVTAIRPGDLVKVPLDRRIYAMTLLALLVKVFGDLVKETGGAAGMLEHGLPLWAFALAVPFMVGFATGATLTYVTVAFPVFHDSIVARDGGGVALLPWLVLAYAGGFVGYLTSPVHMCLVLSTRYFNSKLLSAYARLALPLVAFLAAAVGLFLALGGRFDS
jgi:integral membrane protein (TIGR00529 family)